MCGDLPASMTEAKLHWKKADCELLSAIILDHTIGFGRTAHDLVGE